MAPWPLPKEYQHGDKTLWLSTEAYCVYKSVKHMPIEETWTPKVQQARPPWSLPQCRAHPQSSTEILKFAFERMKTQIFTESFVRDKFHAGRIDIARSTRDKPTYVTRITIEETNKDNADISDEAYSLDILNNGTTVIHIVNVKGGLHALNTLSQLFYRDSSFESILYTPYAPVHIKDSPTFEHRGLNLDISRNRIDPEDVRRTIEALSYNKLNRLHLHASDSQSWPLDVHALPELAAKGAYDQDQIWKAHDLEGVQEYGKIRGVEVYIEIDLPGHTASIFHSHPDLITAYDQRPWSPYALEPPSGQLKLNHPPVYSFVKTLFDDILPRTAPYCPYFHIGGDELNKKCYELDPTVNSSDPAVLKPLLQSFIDHVTSLTSSYNLTPIVWEELLLDWGLDLPPETVIQTWRSPTSLAKAVGKGHRALFGPASHWYLDCGHGTFLDPDPANPDTPIKPPYLDWCSPYKNWRQVYAYDPLADIPEDRRHLVMGGEAHLWGELVDSMSLDGMLWPRVAAAAEVLWRGEGEVGENATRRLAEMRERLVHRGIRAGVVQMEWCLRNRGGGVL